MGYHLTTEAENAAPANPLVSPKTHTPLPRLEKRGLRYYSPEVGRWTSRDPIGEMGALNLFCAFYNSPEGHVDPLGWDVWEFQERQLPWNDSYATVPGFPGERQGFTVNRAVIVSMVVAFSPGNLLPWRIETTSGRLTIDFTFANSFAEQHERLHVADFRREIFEKTKEYVQGQERSRFCDYERAACWKGICEIEAPIKFDICGLAHTYAFIDLPYAISTGDPELWRIYIALTRRAREACESATRALAAAERRCRLL